MASDKCCFVSYLCYQAMHFTVDLNDIDATLEEYDCNLVHKATPDNLFGLLDASSLLWRLEVCFCKCILCPIIVSVS